MPRPNEEEPVVVSQDGKDTVYSHPAFGSLTVSKTQGGRNVLFGSDFLHDTCVVIRMHRATEQRSLAHTRHYANHTPEWEVAMSESQWATFVSAFGVGGGVPCTIQVEPGFKRVAAIPPRTEDEHYREDMKTVAEKPLRRLYALKAKIEAGVQGLTKGRSAEMIQEIEAAISDLSSTLPWVVESYREYMERTREKAKQEIHAHAAGVVRDLGLDALATARAITRGEVLPSMGDVPGPIALIDHDRNS